MLKLRHAPVLLVIALLTALPQDAGAIELTGAWASEADLCGQVFTKQGNRVAFTELSELYGSGFIIEGDAIRGKSAKCTIKSRKETGQDIEISAACATSIMNENLKLTIKVIDDNNINRIFPDMSGMSIKYSRCSF